MGIDGIGKGGGAKPPIDGSSGSSPLEKLDKKGGVDRVDHDKPAFKVEKAGATEAAADASPLGRLRAGEIDVNGYMDLKVNEATRGLESSLNPAQLEEIRSALRDQIATDPSMADLVRMSTGQIPKPPEE